ncbi:hypothetical protein [Enterobacter cloacae]|uniref:VgrG-related protein n=1 Tax=Enterobacter cloacae TaxID=550 RepID=UPI001F5DA7A3|nr:hypothetical protein [Enterobacter cloacae]
MKTCFPARKQNGENYATLDEMMDLIGKEPHGSWLAGTNNMWHGGIHISEKSAPGSVLKPDMAEAPVPLQCMAEGEVVAWRLNKDYQKSTCLGQPVQYTTTFLLVKSNCLPDKDKAQTQLDFYSLYMGLAPLSAFEKHKCMVAKKTVSKRKAGRYESSQNPGAPAHAPQAIGELVQGTHVLILKEATFLNKPVQAPAHSGATELQPFGLAQAFDKDGKLKDEQFWVTLLPEYMAAEGEQYAHLPLWMLKAVEQGTFDAVTKPATALKISAGDAIGFLGEDIAPAGMAKTSSSTYAHIEVLCADSRMPAFLDNPGKVTTGRKYIRVHPDAMLYTLSGDTFTRTTTPVKKDMHIILPVDKCNPKESGGRTYYQAGQSYWLSQDDVDLIDQFNLKELGFIALAEENTPDMSASLQEGWMKSGYRWLAEQLRPERGIQEQQMSTFYKGMIDKMDTDKDGQLSERELFVALHHPEMGVRDIVSRMIVKHQSEWFGGSSHQKWTAFFQDYDVLRIGFAKKWLDDMEWMSQVEPFTSGKAVWHMHPVMFLSTISDENQHKRRDYDLGTLSSKYETGGRGSQTVSGGAGDAGGVSYGAYQMTSKTTKRIHGQLQAIVGGTVKIFISDSSFKWKNEFSELIPGSSEFTSKWKEVVKQNPDEFKSVEHEFIKKTHFDKLVEHTFSETGVDIRYHSHTINDVVWSTAVQHGPSNNIIINAIKTVGGDVSESKVYDQQLISAIYDERGKKNSEGNLTYFSKNSTAVQDGVSARFVSEKKEALGRLKNENDY